MSGFKKKWLVIGLLLLQVLILAFLGIRVIRRDRNPVQINFAPQYWVSRYEPLDNADQAGLKVTLDRLYQSPQEIFSSDSGAAERGNFYVFETGWTNAAPGSYTVTVEYEAEASQSVYLSTPLLFWELEGGYAVLPDWKDTVSFDLSVTAPLETVNLAVGYTGEGAFTLKSFRVETDSRQFRVRLLLWLTIFLAADVAYLFRKRIAAARWTFCALSGIILLASLPVTTDWLGVGHDLEFHLLRIESIVENLRNGIFFGRLSPLMADGLTYATPVFYSDLFLYFPALLRLLGLSVRAAYKCYVVLINILTVTVGYYCFRGILKDQKIALTADLIWITAAYRFSNLYTRAAVGEYTAMLFLPVVALAFWRMYAEEEQHYAVKNAFLMAVGMSGIILNHLLTTEMTAILLAVFCLILLPRTFRKKIFFTWVMAVIGTLIFSAVFLVPFLDYYIQVPVLINQGFSINYLLMQLRGAYIGDLFNFFSDVYVQSFVNSELRQLLMTPGLVLMAALLGGFVLMLSGKASHRIRILTWVSLGTLFVSTNLFPWDALLLDTPFGGVLNTVQFPWRYLGLACVCLTLLAGMLLLWLKAEKPEKIDQVLLLVCFAACLMWCFYTGTYIRNSERVTYYHGADLDAGRIVSGEYKRVHPNAAGKYPDYDAVAENTVSLPTGSIIREGYALRVSCDAEEETVISLPFYRYRDYHVYDETGTEYPTLDDENCRIAVRLPAGFSGELSVNFRVPWYWTAAAILSLLSLLAAIFILAACSRRKRRQIR